MLSQENRLFCRLDGLTIAAREQQRQTTINELSLLQAATIPLFDEATQTTSQVLDRPVCIVGLVDGELLRLKSAVGLTRLGLMNELATTRQLPRLESFCTHVVDSHQTLILNDALTHPAFATSLLVHQYGIRAYLGAPLIAANGCCVGTLAILDETPCDFLQRDVDFLQLMARWLMSDCERQHNAVSKSIPADLAELVSSQRSPLPPTNTSQLRIELVSHLSQELRTPLTSVMGMASVLQHEIYGPLTGKQKEYLAIIHNSGQYLLSLMNEIVELSETRDSSQSLNLASIDIEMLCQQAINTLDQAAQRREQQIRLTVEPGRRIWLVDKEKVRQMLYHLMLSVIQSSTAGSIVRLHVSRRDTTLNLSIWVSHPWLGEGLPYTEVYIQPSLMTVNAEEDDEFLDHLSPAAIRQAGVKIVDKPQTKAPNSGLSKQERSPDDGHRKNVGLMLSQHIAELHGGQISVQGSAESGFRYVITLPHLTEPSPS